MILCVISREIWASPFPKALCLFQCLLFLEGKNITISKDLFSNFISFQIRFKMKTEIVWSLECPTVTKSTLISIFLVMFGHGWVLPGKDAKEGIPVPDG